MKRKHYPIVAKLEVHITDGKGTNGSATYQCPFNRVPTDDEMPEILESIKKMLPDDFRLMTRHESMMHFIRQDKGYRGPNLALDALPDGDEWHDPETANTRMPNADEDEDEEL